MRNRCAILFLSNGPDNLALMAEAFAEKWEPNGADILSAGLSPTERHPFAVLVMQEKGIDLEDIPIRTPEDIELFKFDIVVTLGNFDQACRPNLPGMPPHIHWDFSFVPQQSPSEITLQNYRILSDELLRKLDRLFNSGVLHALSVTRRNLELILNNMLDGVMAHTTNRRIFYFNQAAESITGYHREQVLGHDCHEVFPGRFCGGNCSFCSPNNRDNTGVRHNDVGFVRPDGEHRALHMATMPLTDFDGSNVGALVTFKDNTELTVLKQRLRHHHSLGGLVGKDPKMLALFELIREVGQASVPVLIEGESGTGKELVANAIHDLSDRASKPFVAVNCGALPEGILESELFGHVKGAFTGAIRDKNGRFALADGGTIFLDEIAELSPAMQVKLLRVLQEKQFEPVGGEHSVRVDVRVISATNQNIRQRMEKKLFRRDLFYRLCVVPIRLPPLRERRLDIPMLVEHFVEYVAKDTGRPLLAPSTEAIDLLTSYHWPGNVRELRNAVEFAYVKCHEDSILAKHLPPEITFSRTFPPRKPGPQAKIKKDQILLALARSDGNKKEAAARLGIGRATLYRYLKRYDLS